MIRACLQPPELAGAGPPAAGAHCRRRAFEGGLPPKGLVFEGEGLGELAYPARSAVAAAARYLSRRSGRTAFALIDSGGELRGSHVHRRFGSASVVKAMLLVGYLRHLARQDRALDRRSRAVLRPMIDVSANGQASTIFSVVGQSGLRRLARQAGMTDFASSSNWGATRISAADQARFFYTQDRFIPPRFRRYARGLLKNIVRAQSWGIPAEARPRFDIFLEGGWNPALGIVHQAARLERRGTKIGLAVLQDRTPSMQYGEATIAGVTRRLLRAPF